MADHLLKRLSSAYSEGITDPVKLTEILMSLPKEILRPAVSSYVLTYLSTKTRQAQKRVRRANTRAKALHAEIAGGDKSVSPVEFREAVLDNYRSLLPMTFHVPSINGTRTWGEATATEHLEHAQYRVEIIAEHDRVALMHKKAAEFLKNHRLANINAIVDENLAVKMAMSIY